MPQFDTEERITFQFFSHLFKSSFRDLYRLNKYFISFKKSGVTVILQFIKHFL